MPPTGKRPGSNNSGEATPKNIPAISGITGGSPSGQTGSQVNSSMELSDADYYQDDAPAATGQTLSSGTTGGGISTMAGGAGPQVICTPHIQDPNYITLNFEKTYRWTIGTHLPSWRALPVGPGDNSSQHRIEFQPGSMNLVPVHYLWAYLSPGEYKQIQEFQSAHVQSASCIVNSYGIRLPFTTGKDTSVTANASSQYPITQWIGLDKDHLVTYDPNDLSSCRIKMIGGDYNQYSRTGAGTQNTIFENLSARSTTREYKMPATVRIPFPGRYVRQKNASNQWVMTYIRQIDAIFGEIGVNEYAHSVNGSASLGPVFSYDYKPKNGLIHICSSIYPLQANVSDTATGPYTLMNSAHNRVAPGTNKSQNVDPLIAKDPILTANANDLIAAERNIYENCLIENAHQFHPTEFTNTKRQPHFIIGSEIIRNADDSMLLANWEVSMNFTISIRCKLGTRGIYRLYNTPDAQYLHPHMQLGSYGQFGTNNDLEASRGWLGVPWLNNEETLIGRSFFNKLMINAVRRTDADINQHQGTDAAKELHKKSWNKNNAYRDPKLNHATMYKDDYSDVPAFYKWTSDDNNLAQQTLDARQQSASDTIYYNLRNRVVAEIKAIVPQDILAKASVPKSSVAGKKNQ